MLKLFLLAALATAAAAAWSDVMHASAPDLAGRAVSAARGGVGAE